MWKSLQRPFFLTLITGFLLLFLAACAGGGNSSTSTLAPTPTPSPTPLNIAPYTVSGHSDEITDVAWSPKGKLIASSSKDKTVRVWDAVTGKAL